MSLTEPQQQFLMIAYQSALLATKSITWDLVISPEDYAAAAACESCVETGWGLHMPPNSRNCLGITTGKGYTGASVDSDGTEQLANGEMTGPTVHHWRVYPAYVACFADQLKILHNQKNPDGSLTYQAALTAPTVQAYILAECTKWSTGQTKGASVLQTFNAHRNMFLPVPIEASIPQEMQ